MPHPNSRTAKAARRRKKRMALVEHDLTPEQWAMLQQLWGGCAYCGATDRAFLLRFVEVRTARLGLDGESA